MRRTPALALAALALLVAGCGDGASDTKADEAGKQDSPDAAAQATGDKISGTGYTYNVPEGWSTPSEPPAGFNPDSLAGDAADDDGFMDNVNVILSPAGEVTVEQVETAGVQELETVGATDVTVEDRTEVAGNESAHLRAGMTVGSNGYNIDQFYVPGDGETFIVTFSFSTDVSDEDRAEVTDATLATWAWTD